MKFKNFVSVTKNKKTNQISFHLKLNALKSKGLTPSQILNIKVPSNIAGRGKNTNYGNKKARSIKSFKLS